MPASVDFGPFLKSVDGFVAEFGNLKAVNKEAAEVVKPAADRRAAKISNRIRKSGRTSGTKRAGVLRYGRKSVPWAIPGHFGHFRRRQGGHMVGNFYAFEGLEENESQAVDVYEDFAEVALSKHF